MRLSLAQAALASLLMASVDARPSFGLLARSATLFTEADVRVSRSVFHVRGGGTGKRTDLKKLHLTKAERFV